MTLVLSIMVALILGVSVYLMLSRELKSVAMGVFVLSHAVHLGILAMGGSPVLRDGTALGAPVLGQSAEVVGTASGEQLVDPLPQALILTSIVISFAVTGVMLTLLVITHRRAGTLRVERLVPSDRPEPPGISW